MGEIQPKSTTSWNRLQDLAGTADYGRGPNALMAKSLINLHRQWITREPILELGPAEGFGTAALVDMGKQIWCVEGSTELAASLQVRFPEVSVVNSLFEDFSPELSFGTIVMGHVLEHVDDPLALLLKAQDWLSPDGVILIGVPNAQSLHRQLGVRMGVISHVQELDAGDLRVGHKRVFDWPDLRKLVKKAGLVTLYEGGYWMKLLPNYWLADIAEDDLRHHMALGVDYPEIAAELVAVVGRQH